MAQPKRPKPQSRPHGDIERTATKTYTSGKKTSSHGDVERSANKETPTVRVGGRADITMNTTASDKAKIKANGGKPFTVGGVQQGSPSAPRSTKWYVGQNTTSTDSTKAR